MRKPYLDNIRWVVIALVLVFHVICIFSSCNAPMSYNAPGIPALDILGYLIYPWFMPCLFVVGGISARAALQKRSGREFIRDRARRLLLPFAAYMVLIGPFASELAFRTQNLEEQFAALPGFAVLLIRIVNGMGPSWFLPQMFMACLFLLLVRKTDRKDFLSAAGGKCGLPALLLMYLPVLGSAQVLCLAYTFRVGLYLLLFALGYYVFSHERVQALLEKYCVFLLPAALLLGAAQTVTSWGRPYQWVVGGWLVMLYTWVMLLAVLGSFGRWLRGSGRLSAFMTKRSFGVYLFHYVPMVYAAYFLTVYTAAPKALRYALVLLISAACSLLAYEIFSRIPLLNTLFGLKKP